MAYMRPVLHDVEFGMTDGPAAAVQDACER